MIVLSAVKVVYRLSVTQIMTSAAEVCPNRRDRRERDEIIHSAARAETIGRTGDTASDQQDRLRLQLRL